MQDEEGISLRFGLLQKAKGNLHLLGNELMKFIYNRQLLIKALNTGLDVLERDCMT